MIRKAKNSDAESISDIYNNYVLNTKITFEEDLVSQSEMELRIIDITESLPWLVFERDGSILGYAYASKWKDRCAYRNTVESTIYLKSNEVGKGIGTALYKELIEELKKRKIHAIIGGIAIPNHSSVSLHERFGFEKVAHFKEVGYKFDQWIDVGFWQLLL